MLFVCYKCNIITELTFLKELILIKQANQKSVIFHYQYFLHNGFKFQPNICNECHGLLMMSMNLSDIVILNNIVILNSALIIAVFLVELAKI